MSGVYKEPHIGASLTHGRISLLPILTMVRLPECPAGLCDKRALILGHSLPPTSNAPLRPPPAAVTAAGRTARVVISPPRTSPAGLLLAAAARCASLLYPHARASPSDIRIV